MNIHILLRKFKAIWNIIKCDRYAVFTVTDPHHESEYMQAGKSYNYISENDKIFISDMEDFIQWYKKYS